MLSCLLESELSKQVRVEKESAVTYRQAVCSFTQFRQNGQGEIDLQDEGQQLHAHILPCDCFQ